MNVLCMNLRFSSADSLKKFASFTIALETAEEDKWTVKYGSFNHNVVIVKWLLVKGNMRIVGDVSSTFECYGALCLMVFKIKDYLLVVCGSRGYLGMPRSEFLVV